MCLRVAPAFSWGPTTPSPSAFNFNFISFSDNLPQLLHTSHAVHPCFFETSISFSPIWAGRIGSSTPSRHLLCPLSTFLPSYTKYQRFCIQSLSCLVAVIILLPPWIVLQEVQRSFLRLVRPPRTLTSYPLRIPSTFLFRCCRVGNSLGYPSVSSLVVLQYRTRSRTVEIRPIYPILLVTRILSARQPRLSHS